MIRAVVIDIEGTTTPLAFVKDVLFPYSRARLADFVRDHGRDQDICALLDRLRGETQSGRDDEVATLLLRFIDEDRKDPTLKGLQGRIWRRGYLDGAFVAPLYPDVAPALRRWRAAGIALYVYSSGSVEAQQLLYAHTIFGDITDAFSGWFDTTIGVKTDPQAYRAILAEIRLPSFEVAFLSDSRAELDAAHSAGLVAHGVAREGAVCEAPHSWWSTFDEIPI